MPLRVDCAFGFSCPPSTRCLPHRSGYKCPGEECPMSRDFVCNNDIQCYETWHKCDDQNECEDGTDELECPKTIDFFAANRSGTTIIPVVAGMVVMLAVFIIFLVVFVVVRRRRMQSSSYRQAGVVSLQPTQTRGNPAALPLTVQLNQPTYHPPGQQPLMNAQAANYPPPNYPAGPYPQQAYQTPPPNYPAGSYPQQTNPSAPPPGYEEARFYAQK